MLPADANRALYLGLKLEDDGTLVNGEQPVAELHRPKTDAVIVKNRTGAAIATTLWAFDDRGAPSTRARWPPGGRSSRAPASSTTCGRSRTAADQRTATVDAAKTVLFCTPNEGPLPAAQQARLTTAGLTAVGGAPSLFTVGASPSVQVSAAPTPDLMPIPRLALLPNGTYAAGGAPGTALFAGWTGARMARGDHPRLRAHRGRGPREPPCGRRARR